MAKTIHKYKLVTAFGAQNVLMPLGAKVIAAEQQNDDICLWAEVDIAAADAKETHQFKRFYIIGTGHPMPDNVKLDYISTIVSYMLVFHIYQER